MYCKAEIVNQVRATGFAHCGRVINQMRTTAAYCRSLAGVRERDPAIPTREKRRDSPSRIDQAEERATVGILHSTYTVCNYMYFCISVGIRVST